MSWASQVTAAGQGRAFAEEYFNQVTKASFLNQLISTIRSTTQNEFSLGVASEELEKSHAADMGQGRRVQISGHKELDDKWRRVILACECQALPNQTLGAALFLLRQCRPDPPDETRSKYTVSLKVVDSDLMQITLRFWEEVFYSGRTDEGIVCNFGLKFLVEPSGCVTQIKETAVKVEKIPGDRLDFGL